MNPCVPLIQLHRDQHAASTACVGLCRAISGSILCINIQCNFSTSVCGLWCIPMWLIIGWFIGHPLGKGCRVKGVIEGKEFGVSGSLRAVLALLWIWLQRPREQSLDQALFGPFCGLTVRTLVHPESGPAKPFFQMTNCVTFPEMMTWKWNQRATGGWFLQRWFLRRVS